MEQFCKNLNFLKEYAVKCINNPYLFTAIVLISIYFISFVISFPVYQTQDDFYMRAIVDGSWALDKQPTEFTMWMNILYGRFLAFLYSSVSSKIYWYDIFTYIWMTLSLVVISLSIHFKKHIFYNYVLGVTLITVGCTIFLYPNFTVTSGMLSVAAFVLTCKVIESNNTGIIKFVFSSFLIFLLINISSLIRFDSMLSLLPLCAYTILFFVKSKNLKKCIIIFFVISISLLSSFLLKDYDKKVVAQNPEYSQMLAYHKARLSITEDTVIYQNPDYTKLWKKLEKIVDVNTELKDVGWTEGTYRLFLNWCNIGDEQFYNTEKIKQVNDKLANKLKISNIRNVNINILAEWNIFKYLLLLWALIGIFLCKNENKKTPILLGIVYLLYLVLVANLFKTVPLRVWINIVSLILFATILVCKNNLASINYKLPDMGNLVTNNKNTYSCSKILSILLTIPILLLFAYCPCSIAHKYMSRSENILDANKSTNRIIAKYFTDKDVYLIDGSVIEISSIPFKKTFFNTDKKIVIFLPCFKQNTERMLAYNIPTVDTFKYIASNDNVYYFTYQNPFLMSYKISIASFMMDNYNMRTVFKPIQMDEKSKFGTIYKIVAIPKDIDSRLDINNKEKAFLDIVLYE